MPHTPSDCALGRYKYFGGARFFAFGDRLFTPSGELLKELRFDRGEVRNTGEPRPRVDLDGGCVAAGLPVESACAQGD